MDILYIILPLIGFIIGAAAFFFIGAAYRKRTAEKEIGSAEEEATRIINKAIKANSAKCCWKQRTKSINPGRNLKRK